MNSQNEAVAQFRQVINNYPNSPEADEALDNLKNIYVEQGKPNEYADVARQAGKPLSVSAEDSLTFSAAELQFQNGNTDAALSGFEQYLQRFTTGVYAVDAHFYAGDIYNKRKDWNNAMSHLAVVAERAPNRFADRAVLAAARISFFELKNYAESEKYFALLKNLTASQGNEVGGYARLAA
jgi:TolA-binding protein